MTTTGEVDLSSAWALVDRAQHQLDALKPKVKEFLEKDPFRVTLEERDNEHVAAVVRIDEQPPEDWWLEVGELAGNARAALEHLVFQLSIASGSDPNRRRTQFPIFESKRDYLNGKRSHRERMLSGISSKYRKMIDRYQPFNLGAKAPEHPLSALRSLTDRHKHREKHVSAGFLEMFDLIQTFSGDESFGFGATFSAPDQIEPFEDRHELVSLPRITSDADKEKGAQGQVKIGQPPVFTVVFFGDQPIKVTAIEGMVPFVNGVIAKFERRILASG